MDWKRNWAVFLFKLSSHNYNYVVKYLFTSRDDYFENMGGPLSWRAKCFCLWFKNVACLSSLMWTWKLPIGPQEPHFNVRVWIPHLFRKLNLPSKVIRKLCSKIICLKLSIFNAHLSSTLFVSELLEIQEDFSARLFYQTFSLQQEEGEGCL